MIATLRYNAHGIIGNSIRALLTNHFPIALRFKVNRRLRVFNVLVFVCARIHSVCVERGESSNQLSLLLLIVLKSRLITRTAIVYTTLASIGNLVIYTRSRPG